MMFFFLGILFVGMFMCSAARFPNLQTQFATPPAADIAVDDPILPIAQDDLDAKLVGGVTLLFTHDVTDANRKAATNSVLFAQLAATNSLSQEQCQNAAQWHKAYANSLLRLGWPSISFKFEHRQVRKRILSLGRQILADMPTLAEVGGANLAGSVDRMLDSLRAAGNESDMARVYSQFHSTCPKNAFSVGVVTQDPETSAPILNTVAFETNTEIDTLSLVFATFTSHSVSLKTAHAKLILNKGIYNRIQSVLEQRLGDRVRNYVFDIPQTNLTIGGDQSQLPELE